MQLTAEQVNEFLSKAILESHIGKAVKESVDRVTKDLTRSYDNPFDAVIKAHVSVLIEKEIIETYKPALEAGIKDAMARYMTDEIVGKIISSAMERMNNRY